MCGSGRGSPIFMADLITNEKRGTTYDLYHGIVELTVLLGRRIDGLLWDAICPATPFISGLFMPLSPD